MHNIYNRIIFIANEINITKRDHIIYLISLSARKRRSMQPDQNKMFRPVSLADKRNDWPQRQSFFIFL